ncbi:unnamed protein product [Rotaria magnacalcarata]|nr:unnamed protein product [Rotaria magnacalcarata]
MLDNLLHGQQVENPIISERKIPATIIDARLLRIMTLLSSVFDQLCHFSLKLKSFTSISGPLIISGDIIQQLRIDRLQLMATYILNLLLYATDTFEEKIIFNSICKVLFIQRQRPRVFIQELNGQDIGPTYHCFRVSREMPVNPVNLFPQADTLSLRGYKKIDCVRDLGNCRSSISSLISWSLLINISINHSYVLISANIK